ncbi:MAG TPA: hypothetical protein VF633_01490, partial [Brevundimonas sp.]
MVEALHQVGQIVARRVRPLGEESLKHALTEVLAGRIGSFGLQLAPGVDACTESMEQARRQSC